MHSRVLSERDSAAQAAIESRASELAERLGLGEEEIASLSATDRDPAVQAMLRREAVASLLEQVVLSSIDSEPGARWEGESFLEGEDDENVRTVLRGPWRKPEDGEDLSRRGISFTAEEWEEAVQPAFDEWEALKKRLEDLTEDELRKQLPVRELLKEKVVAVKGVGAALGKVLVAALLPPAEPIETSESPSAPSQAAG